MVANQSIWKRVYKLTGCLNEQKVNRKSEEKVRIEEDESDSDELRTDEDDSEEEFQFKTHGMLNYYESR
uniref:Uncharacterized protein n=1 Tax=Salix viminalis TaxID=40686 RepID=A0A6N2KR59_SALVM